ILDIELADTLPDGWRYWRGWVKGIPPPDETENPGLGGGAGGHLRYVRGGGRRRAGGRLFDPLTAVPVAGPEKPPPLRPRGAEGVYRCKDSMQPLHNGPGNRFLLILTLHSQYVEHSCR